MGQPVTEIAHYLATSPLSLVVMATHARHHLGRFFVGSVAEEVLRTSHRPVIFISPYAAKSQREAEGWLSLAC